MLCFIILTSCTQNKIVQVVPYSKLQIVMDSLIATNEIKKPVYELIVDKGSEYENFMTFHMGTDSFYKEDVLSTCYFLSNGHKVKIYSGVESYFNLQGKQVTYGRTEGINSNENHLLWVIHMYKDSIVEVYPTNYVNPFLLLPPGTSKEPILDVLN